jgi:hypothetical protein
MCLPDFTFRHASGAEVHLELFHRWHAPALARRVEALRSRPDSHLVLGVERGLTLDVATREFLDSSPRVLWFSSFPVGSKIRALLAQRLDAIREQVC